MTLKLRHSSLLKILDFIDPKQNLAASRKICSGVMFLVTNNLNLSKKMENQNIAYNRYEKKMAKYRMNLKKRNNETKASAWLKWSENICIPEKEAISSIGTLLQRKLRSIITM
jgi:hypothetical protein